MADTPPPDGEHKMERIMSLENMISGYLVDLGKLQKDLKEQSAMLKDTFANDAEYQATDEKATEIRKMKKEIQDKIIQNPAVAILQEKVNHLRSEVKETRQALSDYLTQYYMESGLRQITGADGEIHEMVTHVRLVKKRE